MYRYTALDNEGRRVSNIINTTDKLNVLKEIEVKNLKLIQIKKIYIFKNKKIRNNDLQMFCKKLYMLLSCNIKIDEAIYMIENQIKNERLKNIVHNIYLDIIGGYDVLEAFKRQKFDNKFFMSCIYIGCLSQNLEKVFLNLSNYYEKLNRISKKLKSNLIYPVIVSIISFIVVLFLITYVLPIFSQMFEQNQVHMPFITICLINIFTIMMNNLFYIILILTILIVIFKKQIKSSNFEYYIYKYLVKMKTYKKFLSWRFCLDMNLLLENNIHLLTAFDIFCSSEENSFLKKKLNDALIDVKKGFSLSVSLEKINLFEDFVIEIISIGQKSEDMKYCFNRLSKIYDEDIEYLGENFIKFIEPTIIILVGVVVGFIIISIAFPMFEIINSIKM